MITLGLFVLKEKEWIRRVGRCQEVCFRESLEIGLPWSTLIDELVTYLCYCRRRSFASVEMEMNRRMEMELEYGGKEVAVEVASCFRQTEYRLIALTSSFS